MQIGQTGGSERGVCSPCPGLEVPCETGKAIERSVLFTTHLINERRLRNYPRLMLMGLWGVLLASLVLRQGWRGGLGHIIGSDFVTLYAAGLLYRLDIGHLYDLAMQGSVQQALIRPTPLPGVNPYISPPYVAWAYGRLTFLPLIWALLLWVVLTFLFVVLAVHLGTRFVASPWLVRAGLTRSRSLVLLLSSFPFIEGLQAGQNHALTLLLVTAIAVSTLSDRWYVAGALAGLLIYKPQFALGFLILWVVWCKYQALLSFAGVSMLWAGIVVLSKGIEPYQSYLTASAQILQLPYTEGFPAFLMVTPYGLLTTSLPQAAFPLIRLFVFMLAVALTAGLAWIAYRLRAVPPAERRPALALALLYPLLATPYALLHDLLILFPAFLLLSSRPSDSTRWLYAAIATYFGVFLLPLAAYRSGVALLAFVPIGLLVMQVKQMWTSEGKAHRSNGS